MSAGMPAGLLLQTRGECHSSRRGVRRYVTAMERVDPPASPASQLERWIGLDHVERKCRLRQGNGSSLFPRKRIRWFQNARAELGLSMLFAQ